MPVDEPRTSPSQAAEGRMPMPSERIGTQIRRARFVIGFERVWPWLAMIVCILLVFLAVSWLGIWLALPVWARPAGILLTILAVGLSATAAWRAGRASARDALARLDRDSGLAHRPVTSLTDELALNAADPGTRALWDAHRARSRAAMARLTVAPPRPDLPARDPWALRFAIAFGAIAAFFVAGPEREARLAAAFDWSTGQSVSGPGFRLDGWVDPPAYTQVPPLMLDLKTSPGLAEASPRVRVPQNSVLVLRASDAKDMTLVPSGALVIPEATKQALSAGQPVTGAGRAVAQAEAGMEARWLVKGDGVLVVRRGSRKLATLTIAAIPDLPPTIDILNEPQTGEQGRLSLAYAFTDDYGVVSAEAVFGRLLRQGKPVETKKPPLMPAPTVALSLPAGDTRAGEARTVTDLTAHPWAGARVEMTLVARDEPGQEARSFTIGVTLPQRPFTKPLARALVEQRRNLILDPASQPAILRALNALMIAPERFTPDASIYLGLRTATKRLQSARTDADLLSVAEFLWEMALQIEDGELSDAEKALRQAQDSLREALDKGASEQEIRKLTQDLRNALDRFLREFAENQLRNQDRNAPSNRSDRAMRTLTPQDLKSMLDRMEEMARRGETADAQRMLKELKDILENLRTARPGQRQQQQGQNELDQALDDLDRMTRDQQDLRDKTFREGQRKREQARKGQRGQQQDQRGQQGARPQKDGQRGEQAQRGQQGEDGEQDDMADGGQGGQEGMQGLGQRQQALRDQLRELKRRMRENGLNGEQGLEDAEEAMRQAEGALGQGQDGQAVDAQGRALEGLRRGAQGMARQMQQGDGTDQADSGPGGEPGQPGRRAEANDPGDDPLGRPSPLNEFGRDNWKLQQGGKGGTLEQRAREVMEELRRRLGEVTRPQDELDYLQRLLPGN